MRLLGAASRIGLCPVNVKPPALPGDTYLRLTTCKTIVADHMSEFGGGAGMFGWLFFDYAVQDLRCFYWPLLLCICLIFI